MTDIVTIPRTEFEEMLENIAEKAAEKGAATALEKVGLADEKAREDIAEIRGLAHTLASMKDQAAKTLVNAVVLFILGAAALAITTKMKVFGA